MQTTIKQKTLDFTAPEDLDLIHYHDTGTVLFVVEMLRWGDRENHSYVIGVFSTREKAEQAGEAEKTWRAGKYEYTIGVFELDYVPQKKLDYAEKCSEEL